MCLTTLINPINCRRGQRREWKPKVKVIHKTPLVSLAEVEDMCINTFGYPFGENPLCKFTYLPVRGLSLRTFNNKHTMWYSTLRISEMVGKVKFFDIWWKRRRPSNTMRLDGYYVRTQFLTVRECLAIQETFIDYYDFGQRQRWTAITKDRLKSLINYHLKIARKLDLEKGVIL